MIPGRGVVSVGVRMSQSDTFVKDIENYFLTLCGKGVMVSSSDYYLISKWQDMGLSKERVIKGITDAFEQKTGKNIRSICDCKEQVESSGSELNERRSVAAGSLEVRLYIKDLSDNFNRLIKAERSSDLRKLHSEFKAGLLGLDVSEKNVFEKVNEMEAEYFDRIYRCLYKVHSETFKDDVERFLASRDDYVNERSKEKLLHTYLKNLIIEKYISFNPFEVDKR